ncbi:COG3 [[Candida] subhashii]|uniref:Conserved oligomeric Golgi complex subunit 3 n=1 Tax=[Candida] subhashii TaxID=561895 RepID=A0A8J5UMD0_9ASCO|nr:COG3 [[Candida] subhashii]KAG7663017.1 COG3 [[Candida] subhashii]
MPRGRSNTIVAKIASDVPSFMEDHLDLGEYDTTKQIPIPSSPKTRRSRAMSDSQLIRIEQSPMITDAKLLIPLTGQEVNTIWSKYTESYDYDSVLKPQDITSINNLQLDKVLNFKNNIKRNKVQIDKFIIETNDLLEDIDTLMMKYNQISNETLDFDKEANELLEQQVSYINKYEQINQYLKHFEHLDSITKHLSRSGSHLLHQKREQLTNEILKQLDDSLEFIEEHPNFKESEIYGARFRQCMTRALTLIRNYLSSGELKSLADSIDRKLQEGLKDETKKNLTIDLLIYNEFNNYLKVNDNLFNDLVNEISIRAANHEEYNGLLNDVLGTYFNIRSSLLRTYISKNSTIDSFYRKTDHDLVQSCQDQISYFKKIIEKEYTLFLRFFIPENGEIPEFVSNQFYGFLRNILEPLYDGVRLLVLREQNISNLCQLTTLLQKYYEFEYDNNESILDNSSYYAQTEEIKYGDLFQSILEDTQDRLIFRIQKYVDDKLMNYKPKPEDLKIGNRKKSSLPPNERTEINILDIDYPENLFPHVYLPLGKTLTLLSNIYELINSVVFDDLAHYIVHSCIELLKGEFTKLAIAHMGKLDAKLAYLNNLIVLRSQINNFDIQYTRSDYSIDFISGLSDIWKMIKTRSFSFNNNGLLELAKKTVPKIINNMIDANQEMELELNNAVTDFLTECSNVVCEPILPKTVSKTSSPRDTTSIFKDNLLMKIPIYYNQIKIIIDDPAVTKFLMNNLSNIILLSYENYHKSLVDNISSMDDKIREEMSDVMEVDAMYGFINDIMTHMYEEDESIESKPQFNEDILNDLDIRDSTDADRLESNSPMTKQQPLIATSPSPGTPIPGTHLPGSSIVERTQFDTSSQNDT